MVERLQPGRLHGHVTRSLRVSDFILTETAFRAHARLPMPVPKNQRLGCYGWPLAFWVVPNVRLPQNRKTTIK